MVKKYINHIGVFVLGAVSLFAVPVQSAWAQRFGFEANPVFSEVGQSAVSIDAILNFILVALIVVVMIVFVWQVILYIKARWSGGGGPELAPVLYSATVLAILLGIWGITNFLFAATGTEQEANDTITVLGASPI